jgi:hypothetical protein
MNHLQLGDSVFKAHQDVEAAAADVNQVKEDILKVIASHADLRSVARSVIPFCRSITSYFPHISILQYQVYHLK